MSSVRLFILDAFERHGEMHGHQLRAYAERERVSLWTDISVGSLYQALKRLLAEDLLQVVRAEREGNYPERQVCAITSRGRAELTTLRQHALRDVVMRPDPFDLALTRAGPLSCGEMEQSVRARLVTLRRMLADREDLNRNARPYLTPIEIQALTHRVHLLRSEIEWHEAFLKTLPQLDTDDPTPQHPSPKDGSMRAQLLTAFGSTDQFQFTKVPTPVPAPGQLLVRVAAIGINSLETKIRSGSLEDHFPTPLPAILGKEFAGTVEQLGDGTTGFSVGDRVVGLADSGVYAEYAVARPEGIARLPEGLSFERAATLPVAVETASRGLTALGVRSGWTVVVNGATGAVGSAAVQLLARKGVTVIGTASARNQDYLASLGATPVTYGEGVANRIRAVAPVGVDAVFDVAGHGFAATAIELTSDPRRVLTIADFAAARLGILISTGSQRQTAEPIVPILPLAAAGVFRTEIDRTFDLADIPLAQHVVEGGHTRGKVVVTI